MKVVYPALIGEIAKRGIKKRAIAAQIGISERSLYHKLNGRSSFTWEEICELIDCFFPDLIGEERRIFAKADNTRESA